jgi:RNA-directed DNA polymerase
VPWDLALRAVEAVTDARCVLLYVKRWLAAPLEHPDGPLEKRSKGTPQAAVSPILANLFMHYACDSWMARNFPGSSFERYADDAVVHCKSGRQAEYVLAAIAARMGEVGLWLHPDKTRLVYCKDGRRRADHEHTCSPSSGMPSGHAGRAARAAGTSPASCRRSAPEALKARGAELRRARIHRRTDPSLDDPARWLNPIVAGWINYYGRYYRTALDPLLRRVNAYLRRWATRKYKRLRTDKRFRAWWTGLLTRQPDLLAHWRVVRTYHG